MVIFREKPSRNNCDSKNLLSHDAKNGHLNAMHQTISSQYRVAVSVVSFITTFSISPAQANHEIDFPVACGNRTELRCIV